MYVSAGSDTCVTIKPVRLTGLLAASEELGFFSFQKKRASLCYFLPCCVTARLELGCIGINAGKKYILS